VFRSGGTGDLLLVLGLFPPDTWDTLMCIAAGRREPPGSVSVPPALAGNMIGKITPADGAPRLAKLVPRLGRHWGRLVGGLRIAYY